jgi:hypothetical protein
MEDRLNPLVGEALADILAVLSGKDIQMIGMIDLRIVAPNM